MIVAMAFLISIAVAQSSTSCIVTPEAEQVDSYQVEMFLDPDSQAFYICQKFDVT